MVIEFSSPHKDLASILLCYHKEKCLILSAIKTSSFFLPKMHVLKKIRDYHCARYTHLNTLDITITKQLRSLQSEQLICFLTAVLTYYDKAFDEQSVLNTTIL